MESTLDNGLDWLDAFQDLLGGHSIAGMLVASNAVGAEVTRSLLDERVAAPAGAFGAALHLSKRVGQFDSDRVRGSLLECGRRPDGAACARREYEDRYKAAAKMRRKCGSHWILQYAAHMTDYFICPIA